MPLRRLAHLLPVLIVVAAAGIAGCGGAGPSGSRVAAESGSPAIVAHDLHFDRATLDVPAGRPFALVFDNGDGAPHNIAIYPDANATDPLFRGEVFSGPANRVYAVPSLAPGTWYFRCDVHSEMHGEVVAGP